MICQVIIIFLQPSGTGTGTETETGNGMVPGGNGMRTVGVAAGVGLDDRRGQSSGQSLEEENEYLSRELRN
jgi:hypothetical protein